MKCLLCGKEMVARKGEHHYAKASGLDVVLQNVDIFVCDDCGEEEVAIPHITELTTMLSNKLISTFTFKMYAHYSPEEGWLLHTKSL